MFNSVRVLIFYLLIIGFGLPACGSSSDYLAVKDTDPNDSSLIHPEYDYEYIPDVSYDLMEDRFSCLESDIPLHFNDRVKSFIDYFTIKNRDYTRMVVRRKDLYFPIFEKYLKQYDLPTDLKYLAIVESGLNPKAESWAGAVGLWQFMPSTGRHYNLYQDYFIDERMHPEKATEAACKYLKNLYRYFNDWELALAAYNTGPGNVRRAIRRSGYRDNFWEVYRYLPRETRSYVPQFYAFLYVMNYLDEHNIHVEDSEYNMATDTMEVGRFISLKAFGEQVNLCEEDLARLNPELKRNTIPESAGDYPLVVPTDVKENLAVNRDSILQLAEKITRANQELLAQKGEEGMEKVTYQVKSGDVLGIIAERFGVKTSEIRKWNNLGGNRIYVGQKLEIWINPAVRGISANVNQPSTQPYLDQNIYLVQPGDSLWSISKRYKGLTIEKLKQLNELNGNKIKPGQKLKIG